MSNFISRTSGSRKMKVFGSEADGIRWLEERLREEAATRARSGAP